MIAAPRISHRDSDSGGVREYGLIDGDDGGDDEQHARWSDARHRPQVRLQLLPQESDEAARGIRLGSDLLKGRGSAKERIIFEGAPQAFRVWLCIVLECLSLSANGTSRRAAACA